MRKSKLEAYEDVLRILASKPLTLDAIAFVGNLDCGILRERMDFLMEYELVEERMQQKKIVYAITNRGLAIYKTLSLTKRLEKLQADIMKLDAEAQEVQTFQESTWKSKPKT